MNSPRILSGSIARFSALSSTKVARKETRTKVLAVGLGLSLVGFSMPARAQVDQTWNQASADNNWNLTSVNWDAGAAWTQNNNAIFAVTGEPILVSSDPIIFNNLTFNVTGYTIGAGAGSLVLANDQASVITVAGTGIATIAETMADSVNGASSLTKLGTGTLVLSGLNTYTGNTSISEGTLNVSVLNNSGSAGNVGAGGTIKIGAGATAGALTYTGTGETTNRVLDLAGDIGGATITQSGPSGRLKFTSNLTASGAGAKTLTLSGSTSGVGEIAGAIVDNSAANTTALTKTGTGTWVLSGNNTYSGATTLTGTSGVLWVTHANALGATTSGTTQSGASELRISGGIALAAEPISINGGGIGNAGALRNFADNNSYAGTLTLAAQSRIVSDSGTLTMTGANAVTAAAGTNQNLILSGAGNINIAGDITLGSGFIFKDALIGGGTGTLTLGGNNTYTGATTVGAGRLKLDYTTNNTSKLSDFAPLVLGVVTGSVPGIGSLNTGGTVELAGGTHAEIVSGTTLTANTVASTITRSSGNAVIHLNTITANTGTGLIFTAPDIATTDNFPTNGILGFWARMNVGGVSSWATAAGNDDSPIVAFTGYTDVNRLGGAIPNDATSNVRIVNGGTSGNITLGGVSLTQVYSLQMDATGPATIATGASSDVLNVGDDFGGAIWQTANAGSLTIGSAVGSGILTSGATESGGTVNLQLINDSVANNLVVNSTVTDNGFDVVSVTKSGAGTVVLNGNNTFSGLLTVAGGGTLVLTGNNAARPTGITGTTTVAGTLQLQANAGNTTDGVSTVLGSEQTANQPFLLNNGGTLQLRSDSAVTFAGGNNFGGLGTAAVTIDVNQLTGAGTNNTLTFAPNGFNVSNTTINVTGGNGYRLALGNITNVTGANGNNMTLNPTTATVTVGGYTGTTAFTSTLNLSGTSSGNIVTGPVTNTTNATSAVISVTKLGSSSWDLQGANTYTGTTLVREGTLTFSGNRTANSGAITVGDTAGLNATLNITNGNFTMGGTFVISSQANSSTVNQTGGSITMSGTQMIVGNAAVGSVGTYNLSGGTLTGAASTTRGVILGTNTGTTGIFNLSGTGNLALGLSNMQVGRSDSGATNSTGIFNQTGGTAAIGTLTIGGGAGTANDGTSGTLNLTGGTFSATNFTLLAAASNSTANITIGGTAKVTLPAFPTARGLNATANITFDGGTLIPAAASTSYMGGLTNALLTANGAKFDVALGRDITVSQVLKDATGQAGTLTKLGAGTLTLTGANTYTGATSVNAGTLLVNGSLAGPVMVGAAATFGGSATVAGVVTTASGSRIVPGESTVAGTLTVGGLTLASGAAVEFDLGATSDLINVTTPGGLALNGGVFSIYNTGGLTPFSTNGTYSLIDYSGTFTGALSNISIGNAQAGKLYTINNDAGNTVITLTIGDATVTEWNTGSGAWTLAANWTGGVPNAPGAVAKFGAIPQSPTTITVDGAKTVGGIVFDNANSYTLTGGAADTITLSNGIATAGITVSSGSHTIAAPIALAADTLVSTAADTTLRLNGSVSGAKTFTSAGSGTTILSGSNSYGATVVSSGTLRIGDNGTTGTLGSGDVTVSGGATLEFNRSDNITVSNNIGGITGQVTKLGTNTLTLTGTNSFGTTGGGLNLNAGTVKIGSASALPTGVRLSFAGGTLDLNENNATVGSLSGTTGTITDNGLTAGTSTLTYDSSSASTFGGVIANGAARTVALAKSGTGALTLTGNNTFTGGLTITSGAVIAAGPQGNTPIPGNVTLGNGTSSVFLIAGLADNPNQFGANTVLTFANASLDAKFELRGSTTTLAGIDSSPTTTLSIIQNDEVGSPGYTAAPGLATLILNTATDHSFTGLIRNQAGGGLNIVKEGVGSQEIRNVSAAADNFGTATINAGKLTFNFAGTNNTLGASTTVIVNENGTLGLDGTWNMNRPITGSGKVVKQGAATVTISSANSYTGNTIVAEGTLIAAGTAGSGVIPGNVVMGTGAANNIFLVMGAENQFAPTSVIKFDNGPGKNAKLELRGFNQTIAGLDSDADDTLSIVQNQESGTPVAATLTINTTTDHVFNGLIRTQSTGGLLSLVKEGTGTQELRNVAAQGYNFGEATINAGKLVFNLETLPGGVNGHNQLGSNVSLVVNAGGTLGFDGTWDMNRSVFGTGDVVKQGAGTVTMSGSLGHTGKTNVAGGTLLVTGSISGTSELNVQNGGTLGGTGSLQLATAATGNINILEGGKLAPGLDINSGFTIGTLLATLAGGVFDISLAVAPSNSKSMLFELDSTFGNDQVVLTGGPLKIGTGVLGFDDFEFTTLAGFDVGTYKLFDGDTAIVGTLNAANLTGALAPGLIGTLGFGDNGKDLMLTVIPEPGSATLLLASAGSMLGLRRFRRRSA